MKASSLPLATSCSLPKKNILVLRTACSKAIKRHYKNDINNNNNNHVIKKSKTLKLIVITCLVTKTNELAQKTFKTKYYIHKYIYTERKK